MPTFSGNPGPPLFGRRLLALLLSSAHGDVLGELDELFRLRTARDGLLATRRWYAWQSIAFPLRLAWYRLTGGVGGRGSPVVPPPNRGTEPSAPREPWIGAIAADLRLARRRLLRRPGYTVAAILTVGVGVAAIASVYAIANWMLLRPVPGVNQPDGLSTTLLEGGAPFGLPISNPDLTELARVVRSTPSLAAYTSQDLHLAVNPASPPERISGEIVTANYFRTLGTVLAAGRGFDSTHASPAGGQVAVISYALWQRYWNGSPSAIGRSVALNGQPFTVIGIAPPGFHGPELPGRAEIWVAAGGIPALERDPQALSRPSAQVWQVLISRTPAAQQIQATAELRQAAAAILKRGGMNSFLASSWKLTVHPGIGLPPLQRTAVRHTLSILMAAAALFLLLTCANVTNLGLTRSLSLGAATAMHRLLGASLGRVIRERLVESVLIGVIGAMVGSVLAIGAARLVRGTGVGDVQLDYSGVILDWRVIGITALIAILAGVLAGLLPALSARKWDGASLIRGANFRDRRSRRIRHGLVIAQVALSTMLVIGSGLLTRTLVNLRRIDLGFSPANALIFSLDPELQGYDEPQTARLIARLLQRLGQDSRVAAAGVSHSPDLFSNLSIGRSFPRPGSTKPADHLYFHELRTSPSFFAAMGVRLDGENFTADSWLSRDSTVEMVGILNETAARQLFPGQPPQTAIGRMILPIRQQVPIRIIGVVHDARLSQITEPPQPYLFRPWAQGYTGNQFNVIVRTRQPPAQMIGVLRELMRQIDPALPVYDLRPLADVVDGFFAEQRLVASLASLLGAVGLLLAALGLYALLGQTVLERRREMGIRSALGALPHTILMTVVRGGFAMTASGVVLGVAGAAYLSRYLGTRLFGVPALDPRTYLGGAGLLLVVALAASAIPARRAARVQIVDALRED